MKNLIAISAAALTAASANAGYSNQDNYTSWLAQGSNSPTAVFNAGPGYSPVVGYTDTLHNATYSGGTVTGGHGVGVWSLAGVTNATVGASGTADNTNVFGSNTTGTPMSFTFTFTSPTGLNGAFLGGVGFQFTLTPNQAISITATFAGGGTTVVNTWTPTPGSAGNPAGTIFVGFWGSSNNAVTSVTFAANSQNTNMTFSDIYYGLVPAPGAIALVGVAGLVGSRRRRG
jgi:hypothetical protein